METFRVTFPLVTLSTPLTPARPLFSLPFSLSISIFIALYSSLSLLLSLSVILRVPSYLVSPRLLRVSHLARARSQLRRFELTHRRRQILAAVRGEARGAPTDQRSTTARAHFPEIRRPREHKRRYYSHKL